MPKITSLQFLETLFPGPITPARLLLWSQCRRGGTKHSDWIHNLNHAARLGHKYQKSRDVYFGVALQHSDRALAVAKRRMPRVGLRSVRGAESSAALLPALWAEIEFGRPGEKRGGLPPGRDAALSLLAAVPRRPSILVDTGGSFQVYWLLRQPLRLDTQTVRARAKDLLRRVQSTLRAAAAEQGWRLDNTANLAQLLRLPRTLNHQGGSRHEITVEHFPFTPSLGDFHYDPADFDTLAELPPALSPARLFQGRSLGHGATADLRPVYAGCSWLRHCYEDATDLPEREWSAALRIFGRCTVDGIDGRRLAHRISREHSGYNPLKTDDALEQALGSGGPSTCSTIAHGLGMHGNYCTGCSHLGRIKSPIDLGIERRTEDLVGLGPAANAPPIAEVELVHGLAELLDSLGGIATSGEILAELAAEHHVDRYSRLRSALREFFPGMRRGRLPTTLQLSTLLGRYRSRRTDGASIEQLPRTSKGVRWSVRQVAWGVA